MALKKNVAGQKIVIYAYDLDNEEGKTGDAANITANISKDAGALVATDDTNPTEIGEGFYSFDPTQAESNADLVSLIASSTTANIQINPVTIYTESAISVTTWTGAPNETILALVTAAPDIKSDIANETSGDEVTNWVSSLISKSQEFLVARCVLGFFPSLSQGFSRSAASASTNLTALSTNTLLVSIDGGFGFSEVELTLANCTTGANTATELQTQLRAITDDVDYIYDALSVSWSAGNTQYTATNPTYGPDSHITFSFNSDEYHVAQAMNLSPFYGGVEERGTPRDAQLESICAQMAIDAYRSGEMSPESYADEAGKAMLVAMVFKSMGETANNLILSKRKLG